MCFLSRDEIPHCSTSPGLRHDFLQHIYTVYAVHLSVCVGKNSIGFCTIWVSGIHCESPLILEGTTVVFLFVCLFVLTNETTNNSRGEIKISFDLSLIEVTIFSKTRTGK